jgi:transcription elongation factor GreA
VDDDIDSSVINIGCTVKIKDLEFNEEMEYKIVGSTEANSLKGKISNESPVGKALIGAKKGQTVEVEAPSGVLKYKILEITKS